MQWFVRNSTARRASCCKAREALRVELLGHAAEQIGRKRIERGRFFSLSVHYHVFGTGAARESRTERGFAAEFVTKKFGARISRERIRNGPHWRETREETCVVRQPESISLEACRSPCPRLEHTLLRSVEELTVVVDHLLRLRVRVRVVRVRVVRVRVVRVRVKGEGKELGLGLG